MQMYQHLISCLTFVLHNTCNFINTFYEENYCCFKLTVNVGDDYNEHEFELYISVKTPAQYNTTLISQGMNFLILNSLLTLTVKSALRGHSKIDITIVLKTKGSLIKDKRIAECSTCFEHSAIF